MDIVLTKLPNGTLAPASDSDAEQLKKVKTGAGVRVQLTRMRNYEFHKRWFALANYAFEMWSDIKGPMEYRGQQIQPNFNRFRKDLTILAGYYETVFNVRGEMRLEAKSLSFGSMGQDEFERLYSATIQAVLSKILTGCGLSEEKLRNYVDQVMSFD